jgi:hypothetical protein
MSWIVEKSKLGYVEPDLLRLKAAAFLEIAVDSKSPEVAAEARKIAEHCIALALAIERRVRERQQSRVAPLHGDALVSEEGQRRE